MVYRRPCHAVCNYTSVRICTSTKLGLVCLSIGRSETLKPTEREDGWGVARINAFHVARDVLSFVGSIKIFIVPAQVLQQPFVTR